MSNLIVEFETQNRGGSSASRASDRDANLFEQIRKCKAIMSEVVRPPKQWDVPFPLPPAAPLLIVPDDVKRVFDFPKRMTVADFDALETGVLDELVPTYFATNVDECRRMRDHVAKNEVEREARWVEAATRGEKRPLVTDPREDTPALCDADFELIDVDFDKAAIEDRKMPSLSLLKAPLYTEIGLDLPQVRSERRRATLLQEGRASGLATQDTPTVRAAVAPSTDDLWANATVKTFHNVNALHAQYGECLKRIAEEVLCLRVDDAEKSSPPVDLAGHLLRIAALPTTFGSASAELMNQRLAGLSAAACEIRDQYKHSSTKIVNPKDVAEPLLQHFAADAHDEVENWFAHYVGLMVRFESSKLYAERKTDVDSSTLVGAILAECTLKRMEGADAARKIRLVHPRDATLVPVATAPVVPLPDDMYDHNVDNDATLLLLRGAKPSEPGTDRAPHIFDGAQLHVPETVHKEDKHATEDALYHSEASAFTPFKVDNDNHGNYVVVFRDGTAFMHRIKHLKEMHRDHETRTRRSSQYVMWADDEEHLGERLHDASGAKRHRAEST